MRPAKERPVVLLLDGHYSHTRNIEVIDLSRDIGIVIICLPPHSTQRMQPLDVSFMFSFKTYYGKAVENWLCNHPNRIMTKLQVAGLVNVAYSQSASMSNAVSGFCKTGISPFNPKVSKDEDFLAHRQEKEAEGRKKYIADKM